MTTNSAVYRTTGPRPSISGRIRFTGVTRAADPDGTITGVNAEGLSHNAYSITNVSIITPDNTAIYNNTITGATYDNVTAYLVSFDINLAHATIAPIITATAKLNPTGGSDAIVNQIISVELATTPHVVRVGYAVIVFGNTQLDSNNLFEQIMTPSNPFGFTTHSGVNFILSFP